MSVLQAIDLKKYYGTEPNITRALDGVNFSVEDGEFVAVVGTSGSGKSTLLHMMGGLDTPTSGTVIVRGEELAKKNDEQLTIFRRRNIGFIFQNYNLVPILNVYENIVLPVKRYKEPQFKRTFSSKSDNGSYYRNSSSAKKKEKEYLLVDGYNIIYAWEDLKELADANLHAAQTKLMDILSNYQGFKK